jgi:hypothetical protein
VRALGYTQTTAQLMTVPPYAVAAVCTVLMSYIADKTRQRGYCTMAASGTGIIGFILLMSPVSNGVKYFALFLAASAIYPCVPLTISWVANNTNGTFKRGIVMGIVIGWSNLQGVVGSNVYQTSKSEPPQDLELVVDCCDRGCASIPTRPRHLHGLPCSFPVWWVDSTQILAGSREQSAAQRRARPSNCWEVGE